MVTNILDPKVVIFFLSRLPQFVDRKSGYVKEQIAFWGLWFGIQGTLILVLAAILTGVFRNLLQKNPGFWRWQEKLAALVLWSLGIEMLFTKNKTPPLFGIRHRSTLDINAISQAIMFPALAISFARSTG